MSSREPRRWSKNAPDYNNYVAPDFHPITCQGPEACYFCRTGATQTILEPEDLPSHYQGYGPPQED